MTAAIGSLASFVDDAFGRRVSVTKSGTTTAYLYSGNDVVQEQQGGSATANLLLGLGIDERLVRAGETYLTDLLGSTVGLSNGSAIQTSYAYDPYGVATSAGTTTTNAFQFTGRENDGTTAGLMFYRARYYNPAWGRFVSEDPFGIRGGVNLYAYVGQAPITYRDPLGLWQVGLTGGWGWGGLSTSFGYNSGQWNFGAWFGPGAGLSASYRVGDTGCKPSGFAPSLRLSAQYQIGNFGRGGVQGVFDGSGATVSGSWGVGGGVGVAGGLSAKSSGSPYNPNTFSLTPPAAQFGFGSAAFGGFGGMYNAASCTCSGS